MSRGVQTFRQSDLTRALKAARAAGEDVTRVEIDRDGRIVVIIGKAAPDLGNADTAVDTWLGKQK